MHYCCAYNGFAHAIRRVCDHGHSKVTYRTPPGMVPKLVNVRDMQVSTDMCCLVKDSPGALQEIPELVKQHFKDRAMDCGVKSLTLVMHSDSDVHSVRCLCGSLISRIQTERNPRKVLSRHV